MEVVYHSCAGLDVHAKTVVACLLQDGTKEVRTFSTMTDDLLGLSDWLVAAGCTQVAIGLHGRVLEAGLQFVGRADGGRVSQRAACQSGARQKD